MHVSTAQCFQQCCITIPWFMVGTQHTWGWPAGLVSITCRRGGKLGALRADREPAKKEEGGKERLEHMKYNGRWKRQAGYVYQGTAKRRWSQNRIVSPLRGARRNKITG